MAEVTIREATLADVPAIAKVGSAAFDEELIYEHFFPLRSLYPNDYYQYFVNDVTEMLNTPGRAVVVAELDEETPNAQEDSPLLKEQTPRKIVGFATFVRKGSKKELATWNPDSWSMMLRRFILSIRRFIASFVAPNRAISHANIKDYYTQAESIHAEYLTESKSKIDFKTLAVDPDYQRHGIGYKLVEWCGYRSWVDKVLVFGDASTKGLPLYLRVGCVEIGRIKLPERRITHPGYPGGRKIDALEVVVLKGDSTGMDFS